MSLPMGRTPWTRRMYEVVRERKQLPIEELLLEVCKLIPPERAKFERERYVKLGNKRPRKTSKRLTPHERSLEEQIRTGARALARHTIGFAARRGSIVIYEQDGQQWVRDLTDEEQAAREARNKEARRTGHARGTKTRIQRYAAGKALEGGDTKT